MSRVIANRYEIEDEIGRGGMAVVFRARDMRLHRAVALKLLHPFLATQKESATRFHREAEAIAKLHHPNIVEIFDTGQDDETGSQFIVMELIDGPTLTKFVQSHPTQIPEMALAMGCSLCDAIEHAHHANIIHRDIKPENIMISASGQIKLMDFGIARILDDDRMTASGSILGSPAHMPPEIIEGHAYSFPCDIFSLGTVLYFALTGELPFQGVTPIAVFRAILDNQYAPPSRHLHVITRKIDLIVQKCLQVDPSARYQTVAELKKAMQDVLRVAHFELYDDVFSQYFRDPDDFNDRMIPQIKATLISVTRQSLRLRRLPTAIENLNILLAYDPENQEAIALLQRIRMGGVIHKRLQVVGVVALILIVAGVVLAFVLPDPSVETPQAEAKVVESSAPQIIAKNVQESVQTSEENAEILDEERIQAETQHFTQNFEPLQDVISRLSNDAMPEEPTRDAIDPSTLNEEAPIDNEPTPPKEDIVVVPVPKTTPRPGRIKTPKKTKAVATTKTTRIPPSNAAIDEQKPEVTLVHVTQPVFPFDAYAIIHGKQYTADSSGNIEFDLAPGVYSATITCKTRCQPKRMTLRIPSTSTPVLQDVITLDWADATLSINASRRDVYFVALRQDGKSTQVSHLLPDVQTPFGGFNPFGNRPIRIDVYEIPKAQQVKSYEPATLEQVKIASTRVELLPGDARTITF